MVFHNKMLFGAFTNYQENLLTDIINKINNHNQIALNMFYSPISMATKYNQEKYKRKSMTF